MEIAEDFATLRADYDAAFERYAAAMNCVLAAEECASGEDLQRFLDEAEEARLAYSRARDALAEYLLTARSRHNYRFLSR